MLTSVDKAAKAHNAAHAHLPSSDRIPLYYSVTVSDITVLSGTIYVKGDTNSKVKREMTKLQNRLMVIYPEHKSIKVWISGAYGAYVKHIEGFYQKAPV